VSSDHGFASETDDSSPGAATSARSEPQREKPGMVSPGLREVTGSGATGT
jgi:hypothetical protein